ncbi:WD40-repeat-containing domain protein [Melampsora americana]|nr:WD40-repeat-containing domain protein [Melampsora americana]
MESQKLVGIPALAESHCILASASANVFSSCSAWIQPRIGTKRTPKGINADNSDRTPIEGCMVYGAGCQIATWWCRNLNFYQPISFSKGHTSQVTVVKPLHSHDPSASFDDTKFNPSSIDYRFVSGDAKGGVKIWRNLPIGDHNRPSWKSFVELPGHQRSISCLASVQLPPNSLINSGSGDQIGYVIVTGASDGRLMIWKVVEKYDHTNDPTATAELLQTIECGNKIAMDATLTLLPGQSEGKYDLGFSPDRFPSCFVLFIFTNTVGAKAQSFYNKSFHNREFKYVCSLPGHTDWVRCLDFISDPNNPGDVLLASGSQDGYIRLWRCSKACDPTPDIANDVNNQARDESTANKSAVEDPFKALDELTQTLKDEGKIVTASHSELEGSRQPTHLKVEMKRYRIGHPNGRSPWNMTSEAVLFGHEGWITNIHWALGPENHFQLISTSSDRSMIIWKPSADHKRDLVELRSVRRTNWIHQSRLLRRSSFWDQESGQETVLASGWTGGWHRWSRQGSPQIAPTGHSQCVTGLEWDCEGEYILSCSHDQSTRLWGPWRRAQDVSGEVSRPSTHSTESWHELGRPQVHGHDLFGLTFIEDKRTQFVSISEEKVIRVFDTTERFVRLAKDLHVINVPYETSIRKRYENATVPPLGLSNRIEESETPKESSAGDIEDPVRCPPFEDELLSYTLWPEVEKVYGHPSELSAVASSASGKLMASACHATSAISASIRIHSTSSFRAIGNPLESHQLTVTELAFNHDDTFLISVSRDRGWSLWAPSRKFEKAHTRMIWDVSWGPKGSEVFVTGSQIYGIRIGSTAWSLSSTIKFVDAVKSCRFLPYLLNNRLILGVGLEDGSIHLYSSYPDQLDTWNLISTIEDQYTHTGPVERLAFCPKASLDGQTKIRLASGGEDGMVRITDLTLVV